MEQLRTKYHVHLRWMIHRDLREVLEIERLIYDWPWTEEDHLKLLKERDTIGFVAEHDEKIVASMIYVLHPKHIELKRFNIHPDWTGRDVEAAMIRKLYSKLAPHRRTYIQFDVPETDIELQVLLRAQGLEAVSTLREVVENRDGTYEDAYRFMLSLREDDF